MMLSASELDAIANAIMSGGTGALAVALFLVSAIARVTFDGQVGSTSTARRNARS